MVLGRGQYSWKVALGELVVIALGVLAALAADAWNDARLATLEEAEYLDRIVSELQLDTAQHAFTLSRIELKEASLRRIAVVLASPETPLGDTASFLTDLGDASDFGWNVGPLAESATFEDLRSSGKLGLIREPSLRMAVLGYYGAAESEDRRMEARGTEYPRIAYRLVPNSTELRTTGFGGVERAALEGAATVVEAVRSSELSDHIVAETNRALFIRDSITLLRDQATDLLESIVRYRGAMR